MNASEYAIDVHELCKSFGTKKVVDSVSLQIKPGVIYGFLGPNGSGKTTSMRLMCGLLTPDSGWGTCLGYDIRTESREIRRHVGYMTQKFSFWNDLTIRENLDFTARLYEMKDRRKVVDNALEDLGLASRAKQLTGELSGGWKQRLALAACMLHRPRLLLLDEPTAGVDPAARRDFWDELHRLAAQGISVLVSTHYMDEAERCHELTYIAYGRLLAAGTASEIIARQKLSTLSVHAENVSELSERLRIMPGVEQTVMFGDALHVSGKSEHDLLAALAEAGIPRQCIRPAKTGIEDIFIYMMKHVQDNFS
ncbi:MAG: ABC transporter ATP-binding protein [Mailhella sp.]|nr:ABC transporter ATP-binding protein [Mailhella sp.]